MPPEAVVPGSNPDLLEAILAELCRLRVEVRDVRDRQERQQLSIEALDRELAARHPLAESDPLTATYRPWSPTRRARPSAERADASQVAVPSLLRHLASPGVGRSLDSVLPSDAVSAPSLALRPRQRPVRDVALDVLQDIGCLAHTRQVGALAEAVFRRPIPPERFGTLVKDELAGYQTKERPGSRNRPRAVWLCFGLTFDRFEPIKRLLGRSDWPIEERIVAPTTSRVLHARITARLCDLAEQSEGIAADSMMLNILAANHARDLPGVVVESGKLNLAVWREIALEVVARHGSEDERNRKEAAKRLSHRSAFHQLFGLPDETESRESRPKLRRPYA